MVFSRYWDGPLWQLTLHAINTAVRYSMVIQLSIPATKFPVVLRHDHRLDLTYVAVFFVAACSFTHTNRFDVTYTKKPVF